MQVACMHVYQLKNELKICILKQQNITRVLWKNYNINSQITVVGSKHFKRDKQNSQTHFLLIVDVIFESSEKCVGWEIPKEVR